MKSEKDSPFPILLQAAWRCRPTAQHVAWPRSGWGLGVLAYHHACAALGARTATPAGCLGPPRCVTERCRAWARDVGANDATSARGRQRAGPMHQTSKRWPDMAATRVSGTGGGWWQRSPQLQHNRRLSASQAIAIQNMICWGIHVHGTNAVRKTTPAARTATPITTFMSCVFCHYTQSGIQKNAFPSIVAPHQLASSAKTPRGLRGLSGPRETSPAPSRNSKIPRAALTAQTSL